MAERAGRGGRGGIYGLSESRCSETVLTTKYRLARLFLLQGSAGTASCAPLTLEAYGCTYCIASTPPDFVNVVCSISEYLQTLEYNGVKRVGTTIQSWTLCRRLGITLVCHLLQNVEFFVLLGQSDQLRC